MQGLIYRLTTPDCNPVPIFGLLIAADAVEAFRLHIMGNLISADVIEDGPKIRSLGYFQRIGKVDPNRYAKRHHSADKRNANRCAYVCR